MKSAEISLKHQFMKLLYTHLYMSGISIVFGLGAFWWFLVQSNWNFVYSVIFSVIYFCVLYSKAHQISTHDKKGYALTKAYPFKGFVLSLVIVCTIFVFWLLYRFAWTYLSIDNVLSSYTASLYNILFVFFTFPFNGIMVPYHGGIFWYSYFVLYGVPVLAIGLGYLAGYHNFIIHEKLYPLMYEKKQNI